MVILQNGLHIKCFEAFVIGQVAKSGAVAESQGSRDTFRASVRVCSGRARRGGLPDFISEEL